eukprot:gene6925-1238_t
MGSVYGKYVFQPPAPTYGRDIKNLPAAWFPVCEPACTARAVWEQHRVHMQRVQPRRLHIALPDVLLCAGGMADLLSNLCDLCQVDVVCYDYVGYGLNPGNPSESAVFRFGRSLGSGPTCHLAASLSKEARGNAELVAPVGGIILQSALTSALRVVSDSLHYVVPDMFSNISRISSIRCPIFVLHGTEDSVIPFSHAQQLSCKAQGCGTLFDFMELEGADHNDIEMNFTNDYLKGIMSFLEAIQQGNVRVKPPLSKGARRGSTLGQGPSSLS